MQRETLNITASAAGTETSPADNARVFASLEEAKKWATANGGGVIDWAAATLEPRSRIKLRLAGVAGSSPRGTVWFLEPLGDGRVLAVRAYTVTTQTLGTVVAGVGGSRLYVSKFTLTAGAYVKGTLLGSSDITTGDDGAGIDCVTAGGILQFVGAMVMLGNNAQGELQRVGS